MSHPEPLQPLPLNYRSANVENAPSESAAAAPRAAIPLACDTPLTSTHDHAAARAIEESLRREHIPVARAQGADPGDLSIELFVRAADRARAAEIASVIFARRRRAKNVLRKPASDRPSWAPPPRH
jgi:hypothetical protein